MKKKTFNVLLATALGLLAYVAWPGHVDTGPTSTAPEDSHLAAAGDNNEAIHVNATLTGMRSRQLAIGESERHRREEASRQMLANRQREVNLRSLNLIWRSLVSSNMTVPQTSPR